jgi:hypothetical protein
MPAWLNSLKGELADPKRRLVIGGLAGGAVLLGVRSRRRATTGDSTVSPGAAVGTSAGRLMPIGATTDNIPAGYNGSGTDGLQTALNALTVATGQISTLTDQLRDNITPPVTTTPGATPATPAAPTPAPAATGSVGSVAQLISQNTRAYGYTNPVDRFRAVARG